MIIRALDALEILDSRGKPTLEVTLTFDWGIRAVASVPSGKSTGQHEAKELRDGDPARYQGQGVFRAVETVREELAAHLVGRELPPQEDLDHDLCRLDGTSDKGRLGSNAILGVSIAAARAWALTRQQPLYRSLGNGANRLPVPCFNVLNGGAHADNGLAFQEFMLVPAGLPSFREAVRAGAETYHTLAALLEEKGHSTAVGDEGGFAPQISRPKEVLDLMMKAIERAGYRPGEDLFFALDPAASSFAHQETGGDLFYKFDGMTFDAAAMVGMYESWLSHYPILSIEDGLAEDDLDGWKLFSQRLNHRVQIVGDDIFVSHPGRVQAAILNGIGNAVLLKPNQIGTVSEIQETARVAREGGFRSMVSHRSGETTDDFIADLAVSLGCGQIKAGAPARGERLAKYNRLLRIEHELGEASAFAGVSAFHPPA